MHISYWSDSWRILYVHFAWVGEGSNSIASQREFTVWTWADTHDAHQKDSLSVMSGRAFLVTRLLIAFFPCPLLSVCCLSLSSHENRPPGCERHSLSECLLEVCSVYLRMWLHSLLVCHLSKITSSKEDSPQSWKELVSPPKHIQPVLANYVARCENYVNFHDCSSTAWESQGSSEMWPKKESACRRRLLLCLMHRHSLKCCATQVAFMQVCHRVWLTSYMQIKAFGEK